MAECSLVCDTTVLLYLGRIDQIELLSALFPRVCVPTPVLLELDMGRVVRPDTIDPQGFAWISPVSVSQAMFDGLPPNRLGVGEQAAIAYAHTCRNCLVGLDDLRARRLAESLGLRVVGTLGVLLRAKRAGLIPAVRSLLDAVVAQGFHLAPELYQDVLRLADEAS